MNRIKVMIIDDERLAREELKRHLNSHTECVIIGEAANADEAEKIIHELKPDLLLLDIKMPGRTGFELLESLQFIPAVIFTTAYDTYAVKAFEIHALDYLVKPIRDERFTKAIDRVKSKLAIDLSNNNNKAINHTIFVKEGDRYYYIHINDISLIESAGNYAKIYFDNNKVLIKRSLNQLDKMLDTSIFFRINRQEIINTIFINQMETLANGQLSIRLKTGKLVIASNRQSALLKNKHVSLQRF